MSKYWFSQESQEGEADTNRVELYFMRNVYFSLPCFHQVNILTSPVMLLTFDERHKHVDGGVGLDLLCWALNSPSRPNGRDFCFTNHCTKLQQWVLSHFIQWSWLTASCFGVVTESRRHDQFAKGFSWISVLAEMSPGLRSDFTRSML